MSSDFKFSKELIRLRRSRVLELVAQAVPQTLIAEQLGVSPSTISLDMQYLRETAKSNIQNHIEEKIPMQFSECETGLKLILRKAHEVMSKSTRIQDQLHAMGLTADIYAKLMDLSTNGAILQKTVKWVEDMKKILPTAEEQKQIDKIFASESDSEEEKDKDKEDDEDIIEESEEESPKEE